MLFFSTLKHYAHTPAAPYTLTGNFSLEKQLLFVQDPDLRAPLSVQQSPLA